MEFVRVRGKDTKYIKNQKGILYNTAFIAYEEEHPIALIVFLIHDMYKAEIIEFQIFKNKNQGKIINGFIDEFLYWNPFIKKIFYNSKGQILNIKVLKRLGFKKEGNLFFTIKEGIEIFKIDLQDFRVAQLTVSLPKVNKVKKWIENPEDVIVACVKINDEIVCVDGNSRLVGAYLKGFNHVYGYILEDDHIEFYNNCLNWCNNAKIYTIKDLSEKIVSPEEHESLWIDRCSKYFNS